MALLCPLSPIWPLVLSPCALLSSFHFTLIPQPVTADGCFYLNLLLLEVSSWLKGVFPSHNHPVLDHRFFLSGCCDFHRYRKRNIKHGCSLFLLYSDMIASIFYLCILPPYGLHTLRCICLKQWLVCSLSFPFFVCVWEREKHDLCTYVFMCFHTCFPPLQ